MSHFSVWVIGDDVTAALAPFQENNMGDCQPECMTFHDTEDESRKAYSEEGVDMVLMPDGSHAYEWDERFRVPGTIGTGSGTRSVAPYERLVDAFVEEFRRRLEERP